MSVGCVLEGVFKEALTLFYGERQISGEDEILTALDYVLPISLMKDEGERGQMELFPIELCRG
jgi:hypothetical protein